MINSETKSKKFVNYILFLYSSFYFHSMTQDPDQNLGSGSKFNVFGSTTLFYRQGGIIFFFILPFSYLFYNKFVMLYVPGQPEEGLLKVVVWLGGDVVVLEVLFPVEDDALGLHLPVLDVHLISCTHETMRVADSWSDRYYIIWKLKPGVSGGTPWPNFSIPKKSKPKDTGNTITLIII